MSLLLYKNLPVLQHISGGPWLVLNFNLVSSSNNLKFRIKKSFTHFFIQPCLHIHFFFSPGHSCSMSQHGWLPEGGKLCCIEDSFKALALVLTAYLCRGLRWVHCWGDFMMPSFGNRKAFLSIMKDPPAQVDRYRYRDHSGCRISGNEGKGKGGRRNSELYVT